MFAGLKFINGYSPILASGVGKEFGFAIHGEFDWAMQKKLLETSEGDRLLVSLASTASSWRASRGWLRGRLTSGKWCLSPKRARFTTGVIRLSTL